MKDIETKIIIQKSLKSPSSQFTDNLMLKIEIEDNVVLPNYFNRSLLLILSISLLAGILIYFGSNNGYVFPSSFSHIQIPRIYIKLSFVSIILYGFYQLLSLYEYQRSKVV
jgi:hypothetical protein